MTSNLPSPLGSLSRFNVRIAPETTFFISKFWASFCKRDIKFGEILRRLGSCISLSFDEDFTFKVSICDEGFRVRFSKLAVINYIREADSLPRFWIGFSVYCCVFLGGYFDLLRL